MSWEDIKKKYGNSQMSNNSSWQRIKSKYSQLEKQQKEKEEQEQKKLLEKLNLPTKEVQSNSTVSVPNANSKNNDMTNVRNSMATSLSQQLSNATTTNDKGIVTSISDAKNRIEADTKNKNIAKGGVDAFNEYMDSTLNAIPGGAKQAVSGLANTATTVVSLPVKGAQKLAEITGNENLEETLESTYDKIINVGKSIHEEGYRNSNINSYVDNDFVRSSSQVVSTISQMATSYGIGQITGIPATVIQGMSVGGTSAQEVLNENKDNIVQATITGMAKGYASYFFEKAFDANILTRGTKKTSIQNAVNELISNKISSKFGQNVAYKTVGIFGENVEEFLEDTASILIDKLVNNKDLPGFKQWLANTSETIKITTLSTFIMQLMGFGGTNFQEVKKDMEAKKWINEAQKIIDENNLDIKYDTNKLYDNNIKKETIESKQTLTEEANPYRNTAKANKLIKEKNSQIRELQSQIEQTDSIETKNELQAKMQQIETEYNNKIQELYDDTNEYANLQQNSTNNQNNGNNQQITQTQQNNSQNGISGKKNNNYISEEFKKGIEQFKSGNYTQDDNIVILNETPQWLYNKGFEYEQPIVLNMDKLNTIMKEPKGNFDGKNQHGITMDIIEQLPEAISNPLNVIKNPKYNNRYVIVTHLTDQYGDIVIVPIEMNTKGYIEGIETTVNRATSTYGKEYYDLPKSDKIDSYMEQNKDNIVYDIDTYNKNSSNNTNHRLQLPSTSITATNNSVPQNTKNVNTTTNNYSMQESENNSGSFSMPTKQNTTKMPQKESNVDKYNRYKQNILKGRGTEVNNLIKNKNETINKLEEQIAEKKQLLNSKKDKTTNVANNLKMQIESLEQRKSKIENEYNSRIDRKFAKATKDVINFATKKEMGTTRKEIQQNLLEDTDILNESLDNANNITMLNMNRTDPIRLQEKVFGKELGSKINDMFFNKVKHNTAEKTRFLNRERADIKDWGIKAKSFESEILQKYTEKFYVGEDGKEIAYTDENLIKDISSQKTRDIIKKTSKELRKKYDNYIDTANEVLVSLGYDAIPKRKDYVRHFTELNDIFTQFGIPGKFEDSLPTDINGTTDTFRPGKNFFANAQKRYGNKTTYDAITGIDGYIEGVSNLIYHTEDIQRLRAFDKYIRETYGQSGFENLDNLSEDEKKIRIQKISENHLSNYVSWLTEYTNNLAGKKSKIDRSIESLAGRNIYSALNTIKQQTGSNMTGFNIGSALTNFISVTQGASKTKKLALLKGTANTIQNIFINDGFVEKSDFLTNRFGSDKISKTVWEKVSNAGQVFMSATDYFSSNVIVRSKYYENLAKGMSESDAIKNADDFGARILGDRSQGATANVFNSKMLGIVTQFQLETNNQMDTMIHDTLQDFKIIKEEAGTAKASMGAVWTLGQMAVYQHIFNNLFEAIAGRRPAFDIIDVIKTALGVDDDEDSEDTVIDNLQQASKKLIESLPFINLLSEDARVPIASALPNLINVFTGESKLKDEASKLVYLLPPTGGSQVKKSIDGIKTVIDGGSYVTNSDGEKELRFPVENASALDYVKAGTLGKYSLPLAKEYVDRNYKRLSAKQTKTYEESNLPYKEYLEYLEADLDKTLDKINYLESKDMTTEQKWGIYKNDLFSDTIREEDGGSQLKDAEYITSNGVSKSDYIKIYNKAKKNEIDMPTADEYKEMKSNNIKLNEYIDYKIQIKNVTKQKKRSGDLDEDQNLKNADKIQILLDSSFSDATISSIYDSYIKSEKDTEYDIMMSAGIDIKEYLKYKQQEFESDYYDDGTLTGKTISKSKQKKVVEYLNSMKIKGNQRLLLYAMQGYSMTSSQKNQLAQYVKGLDIDTESKLKLYDKFSGFTVYKNGQVRW